MNPSKSAVKYVFLIFIFFQTFVSIAISSEVLPVLEFPEKGMDDPEKYRNYVTRFFQDSKGNSFQIYIDQSSGRIVNLWADAANESLSFTVRDGSGSPAKIQWESNGAVVDSQDQTRSVQYTVTISSPSIQIGHPLLGSMRKERDFVYFKKHLLPYDSEPFHEEELKKLIANINRLPDSVRLKHLELLHAKNTEELAARLDPERKLTKKNDGWIADLDQTYFDRKNHLSLELSVSGDQTADLTKNNILFRSTSADSTIKLSIKVITDSAPLTPLNRESIFTSAFTKFCKSEQLNKDPIRYKWIDREIKGLELLSSQEKLMAGLPNFATYFGRDTMMSSLMMEPIWTGTMLEHAIGSVLNKLSPSGDTSHEEALGGQAIRENADQYNKLIEKYLSEKKSSLLEEAQTILADLQSVRENYRMVDDDFQLAVLVERYFGRKDVTPDQKRAFLLRNSRQNTPFITLLVRNFAHVVRQTNAYAETPIPVNLVSFPQENGRWLASSWRDSGVGYGGGRFAMDVNAIWVPQALEAIANLLNEFQKLGFTIKDLETRVPEIRNTKFQMYANNPEKLQNAIKVWNGAAQHFKVHLTSDQIKQGVEARLSWLPEEEAKFWRTIWEKQKDMKSLEFLALSLDEKGKQIPIINTDPATLLYLENFSERILNKQTAPDEVLALTNTFLIPYPTGLFVEGLGPLVANDNFASRDIWETFKKDPYHSPTVVWGREVNLFLLGLLNQIQGTSDGSKLKDSRVSSYREELKTALSKTLAAVEASGLKHNELWTYRIENGKLMPVRYGTSSDIQLWNLTDLSVQFLLASWRTGD